MILVRFFIFLLGFALVWGALLSTIKTFVVARSTRDWLSAAVFGAMRYLFELRLRRFHSYAERDHVMAFFAPLSLLTLLPVWLALVLFGYMSMFWALGAASWLEALRMSGSSLFTLGSSTTEGPLQTMLIFSEATIGLMLVALLIAYLPTMYAAFARRETAVTLLEVRAGDPPSAVEMIRRFQRLHGLESLTEQWRSWEIWFAELEESHTSLAPLVFFRSPRPGHSWITAAGTVLDAASLTLSTVDIPNDPAAALCIRAGYLALRHIAETFGVPYDPKPAPTDPIHVTRAEFDAACEQLAAQGVPLKADRDQAWRDFAGWRVNYDFVLLALAGLTVAPPALWSGDRPLDYHSFTHMHRHEPETRSSLQESD